MIERAVRRKGVELGAGLSGPYFKSGYKNQKVAT